MLWERSRLVGSTVTYSPTPASIASIPVAWLNGGVDADWQVTGATPNLGNAWTDTVDGYVRWSGTADDPVTITFEQPTAVGGDWIVIVGSAAFGHSGLPPTETTVQHSDNGTDWTTVVSITNADLAQQPGPWVAKFDISAAGDHEWWRVGLAIGGTQLAVGGAYMFSDVALPKQIGATVTHAVAPGSGATGTAYITDGDTNWALVAGGSLDDGSATRPGSTDSSAVVWGSGADPAITFDLLSAQDINLVRVWGIDGSDFPRTRPGAITIEHSDNGTDFTAAADVTGLTTTATSGNNAWMVELDTSASPSHRYWRVSATNASGAISISEVELLTISTAGPGRDITYNIATPAIGGFTTPRPVSFADETLADWATVTIGNMVDGYMPFAGSDANWVGWNQGIGNQVIGTIDLGAAVAVDEFRFVGFSRTAVGRPTEVILEHSDDSVAWTTYATRTGLTASETPSWWYWRETSVGVSARYWRITREMSSTHSATGAVAFLTAEGAVPSAPTNPAATANSASQITVTWDDVANETGYRVERSLDGTTGWTDVSGNLAADTVSWPNTGLTAETQYFYRVFAFNADGDSPASTTVNATTGAASGGGNRMGGTGAIRKSPRGRSGR